MLEIKDVYFSYNDCAVLNGIELSLENHEIIGLVGPNGSGKTTLIKNIMNILTPLQGEIRIGGLSSQLTETQKNIMYLSSEDVLPEFLSGEEYIQLLLSLYDKQMNNELLFRLLDYYAMGELFKEIIENYSHGTKKKLQLIGAFIVQPRLLIIDETLNGMDIEAREITKKLLIRLLNKETSILLCTHDFSLVEELRARALLIHEGKIYYDSKSYLNEQKGLRKMFYDMIKTEEINYELD